MGAVSAVFWGVLLLSVLVFVHEGAHFLVAHAFGVRVTEFFLGMPCPIKLSHVSKKYGTEFGVTPILLGGYNRICGMEGSEDELLPQALSFVVRKGTVGADELAQALGCDTDRAMDLLVALSDWGSVKPFYDPEKGEKPSQSHYPETFKATARDVNGLTSYDNGNRCGAPGSSADGEPHAIDRDVEAFYHDERSHTFLGIGFWKRVGILVAGAAINILCAILLIVYVYSVCGVTAATGTNTIGNVVDGSLAQQVGLSAGDTITAIGDDATADWDAVTSALQKEFEGTGFDVTYLHDGSEVTRHVDIDPSNPPSQFGIYASTKIVHLDVLTSLKVAGSYVTETASYVAQLLQPAHTKEIMDNSTSIVGISVVASNAASQGLDEFLFIAALVSLSLGFMNLLPIPPLDGGKILIEAVEAISRRPVPVKVQNAISYVGIALFLGLFVYTLRLDFIRFIIG